MLAVLLAGALLQFIYVASWVLDSLSTWRFSV